MQSLVFNMGVLVEKSAKTPNENEPKRQIEKSQNAEQKLAKTPNGV